MSISKLPFVSSSPNNLIRKPTLQLRLHPQPPRTRRHLQRTRRDMPYDVRVVHLHLHLRRPERVVEEGPEEIELGGGVGGVFVFPAFVLRILGVGMSVDGRCREDGWDGFAFDSGFRVSVCTGAGEGTGGESADGSVRRRRLSLIARRGEFAKEEGLASGVRWYQIQIRVLWRWSRRDGRS